MICFILLAAENFSLGRSEAEFYVGGLSTLEQQDQFNTLARFIERSMHTNVPQALQYAKAALRLARKNNYEPDIAIAYALLGRIYGEKICDYKTGISYLAQSTAIAEKLKYNSLVAGNYLYTGIFYYRLGFYSTALDKFSISGDLYKESVPSLPAYHGVQVHIAAIYAEMQDILHTSQSFFDPILQKAEELKSDSLFVLAVSLYTGALIRQNEFEKAEELLHRALPLVSDYNEWTDFVYTIYLNLGEVSLHRRDLKEAFGYFEKAKRICKQYSIRYGEANCLMKLGKASFLSGMYEQSERHYLAAFRQFQDMKMKKGVIEAQKALSDLTSTLKQFEKAFAYRTTQLLYTDSLHQEQNKIQRAQMQSAAASEKEQLIQQKDDHINQLYLDLLTITIIAVLFFGLLYLNHQRLRAARDKAILAHEKLLLAKELQDRILDERDLKLKEEQLEEKLEFNAKTLTANTLNLIQKNELLEKIKASAEEIRSASAADLPAKIKTLLNAVNFALNIDKDWDNFKVHFEQVHNNFFDNLKAMYPNLNSSDLKLCALLKLNLDTKEIATIMSISPESAKVARSRLRKKLQLDTSSNLSSFITQV